jgi:CDP-glucose 4,6-dehydratase
VHAAGSDRSSRLRRCIDIIEGVAAIPGRSLAVSVGRNENGGKMQISGMNWKNAKVLVTGASGFKGGWLCATLLRLGAQVYGTVRNQHHPLSAFEIFGIDDKVVKVDADISDKQQVYDLVNSIEPVVIFHLAAKALVPVSLRDPRRTFEVNFMGTLNLLQACRALRICSRILICSTDHVFGNIEPDELPAGGFDERSRVSYGGPYDTSKAAMELMVRCYHYSYWEKLPAIGISRCANVFGFGDTNQRRVIPLFIQSAVRDRLIPLKYRLSGRQFIHISDSISGYIKAASSLNEGSAYEKEARKRPESRMLFTPTFHFAMEKYEGTEHPYICMEPLARLIAGIYRVRIDYSNCIDYPLNENKIQALNCAETKKALGWEAKKPFAAALSELGEWYKEDCERTKLKQLINDELEMIVSML